VNARDAMPQGGRVVIETGNVNVEEGQGSLKGNAELEPGPWVYLGVSDTGTGMTEEVQRHLFEPFFTTKEPGKGTGLGLATIYSIVQQSGGKIEVTSKPGAGTTFHIYLRRAETTGASDVAPERSGGLQRGSETVLVVEDQDLVRRLVKGVLENCGYRVLLASSGHEALALAEGFPGPIHLLISDLIMPVMNGQTLANRLSIVRPDIRILFISGYSDTSIDIRGIEMGDLGYLAKPFTPMALTEKVRETLIKPLSR